MQAFTTLTGRAAPLLMANVDTDVIIRIERLAGVPRAELGRYAFEALRYRADGSDDPEFVLNAPEFRGAPILLAGANFGCGSSREAAVWTLMGIGIRCVIAPSFGDIFYGNCVQNGVLPIALDAAAIKQLTDATSAGRSMTVDLVQQQVTADGNAALPFAIDTLRRDRLLSGLDAIDLALRDRPVIQAWQEADRARRPWVWNPVCH
jgi:3-isopropylmalate/(R)-2-methylmalate dehydratase small subunit